MILVTGWRIKRLENLILAASSDVPAKAELSFCQLLTEHLIVIWPFPIFSSISFGSEWWENLLNKSLNSSIGILTISCRRTLRFGRMKIKIFTSIILTFLQIHTDAFIRWSVHLNLDPNNAMNLSQPEYYIAVKSVDINFLFAKVKMFTRDIEIVLICLNSFLCCSIETSHRATLDSFEPSASLQCDLHQRFTFVNFEQLENTNKRPFLLSSSNIALATHSHSSTVGNSIIKFTHFRPPCVFFYPFSLGKD